MTGSKNNDLFHYLFHNNNNNNNNNKGSEPLYLLQEKHLTNRLVKWSRLAHDNFSYKAGPYQYKWEL